MTETELEHLARHLGHDPKTHREFYRLSDSTVQLSKVCLSLILLHFGILYITMFSARPRTTQIGLAVQVSTIIRKGKTREGVPDQRPGNIECSLPELRTCPWHQVVCCVSRA